MLIIGACDCGLRSGRRFDRLSRSAITFERRQAPGCAIRKSDALDDHSLISDGSRGNPGGYYGHRRRSRIPLQGLFVIRMNCYRAVEAPTIYFLLCFRINEHVIPPHRSDDPVADVLNLRFIQVSCALQRSRLVWRRGSRGRRYHIVVGFLRVLNYGDLRPFLTQDLNGRWRSLLGGLPGGRDRDDDCKNHGDYLLWRTHPRLPGRQIPASRS